MARRRHGPFSLAHLGNVYAWYDRTTGAVDVAALSAEAVRLSARYAVSLIPGEIPAWADTLPRSLPVRTTGPVELAALSGRACYLVRAFVMGFEPNDPDCAVAPVVESQRVHDQEGDPSA